MFKKVLSMLLVSMMLFSSMVVASAEISSPQPNNSIEVFAQKNIGYLLNNLKSDPEAFGMKGVDFNNITLGEPLIPYNADNDYKIINDIIYYPVLQNNKIIAIYTIAKSKNDTLTGTLGRDFADKLNNFINSNNEKFALVLSRDGLYVINSSKNTKLENNNYFRGIPLEITTQNAPEEIITSEIKSDYRVSVNSSIKRVMLRSTKPDKYTMDIDVVRQYNDKNCWAAVTATIGNFMTNKSYTAREICDKLDIGYDKGGNLYDVEDGLEDIYDLNCGVKKSSHYRVNTEFLEMLLDDKPLAAGFMGIKKKYGHMLAICGYTIHSQGISLTVADPNYNYYRTSTYNDDEGDYTYVLSGIAFEWKGQCHIK